MKKLLLCALFVFGVLNVTNLNAENLSDEQFDKFFNDCLTNKNKISCQKVIDDDLLMVEQCDKSTCDNTGRIYEIAENYQQALKYFQKACELNDEIGCFNLASLYYKGQGVKQNFAETFKFNKKACDLNFMGACYNVGLSYEQGKGVRQDFASARKYYENACNANFAYACNNLGYLYGNGKGVKQNKSTAKKYYGKACDLGDQIGCDNYRMLNEQDVK